MSESSMVTLPTELDVPVLSTPAIVDHKEPGGLMGESGMLEIIEPLCMLLRDGIFIALPPMTGDESGEDCSAKVE